MNRLEMAINTYYSKTLSSSDESLYAILNSETASRKTSQSFVMSLDNGDLVSPDVEKLEM